MSRMATLARRAFLVGSAAVAGGVAFGYYRYRRAPANPLLSRLGPGETALTPYVLIDQSGVTIITPRADLGQGAYSLQAALVAEELDVAWADIKVDPGPPGAAYYNAKVLEEGFPIAATDEGALARALRVMGDVGGKFLGLQITGGSSTTPDAFEKLRMAGAVARETLLSAASQQTGVARSQLKTRDGAVLTPDGQSLSYASLASLAAKIEPPGDVKLRPPSSWRYLGKPMRRIDILSKSTGTAKYGIDLSMPGMVHATVRTNPRIGGALKGFDASAAEKARGVIKVVAVTGASSPTIHGARFRPPTSSSSNGDPRPIPPPPRACSMLSRLRLRQRVRTAASRTRAMSTRPSRAPKSWRRNIAFPISLMPRSSL